MTTSGINNLKAMYSNYNELTLPISQDGKYKVGDIFTTNSINSRTRKFNGLEIKSIYYRFGVVLLFDRKEWENNIPKPYKTNYPASFL